MLFTSFLLYRLAPDQETAQFLEIMLNICLLSFQGTLSDINQLEMLALQLLISMIGALVGQLAVRYVVKNVNSTNSYCFWKTTKDKEENNITVLKQESLERIEKKL